MKTNRGGYRMNGSSHFYRCTGFSSFLFFLLSGLDESVKMLESMGGWCRGQIVDISKREEVYKAAAEIKNNYGDVSFAIDNYRCLQD